MCESDTMQCLAFPEKPNMMPNSTLELVRAPMPQRHTPKSHFITFFTHLATSHRRLALQNGKIKEDCWFHGLGLTKYFKSKCYGA